MKFLSPRKISEAGSHLGWTPVPAADEAAIRSAWRSHLQPNDELRIPSPSRSWHLSVLADLPGYYQPAIVDLTYKLCIALRHCTGSGERLVVIEWQHEWHYYDPHAASAEADTDQCPMPLLFDGDAYHIVAPDFRFGVITDWQRHGVLRVFGDDLLSALGLDAPETFLQVCGPGVVK